MAVFHGSFLRRCQVAVGKPGHHMDWRPVGMSLVYVSHWVTYASKMAQMSMYGWPLTSASKHFFSWSSTQLSIALFILQKVQVPPLLPTKLLDLCGLKNQNSMHFMTNICIHHLLTYNHVARWSKYGFNSYNSRIWCVNSGPYPMLLPKIKHDANRLGDLVTAIVTKRYGSKLIGTKHALHLSHLYPFIVWLWHISIYIYIYIKEFHRVTMYHHLYHCSQL